MAKFKDEYWAVLNAAFVTIQSKNDPEGSAKMLVKVNDGESERLIGFLFKEIKAVENMVAALERVRDRMLEDEKDIHPKLREEIEGDVH